MEKIKIICIVENSISHLNPIFNLIDKLTCRGNILETYFFSHISFQTIIEEKGFSFIESRSLNFGLENHEIDCHNYIDKLLHCLNENNYENRRVDLLNHIEHILPQYIFVDTMLWGDQIVLEDIKSDKLDFKIKNIQTIFNTHFSIKNLPINSRFVPKDFHITERALIYLIWLRYWLVKIIRRNLYQVKFLGYTEFLKIKSQIKKINKLRKINLRINIWNSYCPSLYNVENLILLPKSFEFTNEMSKLNKHIGYFDNQIIELIDEDIIPKDSKQYDKIVLISQGSLQQTLNSDLNAFYFKFLALIRSYPQFYFIASFDKTFLAANDLSSLHNLTARAYIPQKNLLTKVDLFISHGGANSVLESILAECPIFITLGNHIFDQNGNAARVKFHGCGEFVDFHEPLNKWMNKLDEITQNYNSYKEKIQNMKQKILIESYDLENLIFN
jgi:zeaxanthin glucosyltransferase